ncbi:hypothetical protein, partial [Segeticoccus rhizosphaerae]|uniref:hypothetical protein n=1 Tax=Segeticoccus rhizosphaerae TaxID=1104777 RepID=UPI0012655BB9
MSRDPGTVPTTGRAEVAPSRPRTAGIAVALLALAAGVLLCGPLLPSAEPGPMLLSADAEGASTSTAT